MKEETTIYLKDNSHGITKITVYDADIIRFDDDATFLCKKNNVVSYCIPVENVLMVESRIIREVEE